MAAHSVPEELLFGGIGKLLGAKVVPLNRRNDGDDLQYMKRASYEV